MVISRQIKDKLSSTPAGVILTIRDFGLEMRYQQALVKALSRLVQQGGLQRVAKGKYYVPKKTIFGKLKPSESELIKDYLGRDGKVIGYVTGNMAFASMGLTTQISSSIMIGTNKYRRPVTRDGLKIFFLQQGNQITSENIPLLRILDALRLLKKIPASSPDECVVNVSNIIRRLSDERQKEMAELSLAYPPCVRALLGAIYELIGIDTYLIRPTLNVMTSYKLQISETALPNKKNWNII